MVIIYGLLLASLFLQTKELHYTNHDSVARNSSSVSCSVSPIVAMQSKLLEDGASVLQLECLSSINFSVTDTEWLPINKNEFPCPSIGHFKHQIIIGLKRTYSPEKWWYKCSKLPPNYVLRNCTLEGVVLARENMSQVAVPHGRIITHIFPNGPGGVNVEQWLVYGCEIIAVGCLLLLDHFEHGNVTLLPDPGNPDEGFPEMVTNGTTLHFSCQDGYYLEDSSNATCLVGKESTLNYMPSCAACHSIKRCKKVTCSNSFSSICQQCNQFHRNKGYPLVLRKQRCKIPPVVVSPLFIRYPSCGICVKLTPCSAVGSKPLTYMWRRAGSPNPIIGNQYRVLNNGSLEIHNISSQDDDVIFIATIHNHVGVAQCIIHLVKELDHTSGDYEAPWVVGNKLIHHFSPKGSVVMVSCGIGGTPPPTKWWIYQDSGDMISRNTSDRVHALDNSTLVFSIAEGRDTDIYICFATNGVGNNSIQLFLIIYDEDDSGYVGGSLECLAGEEIPVSIVDWETIYMAPYLSNLIITCYASGCPLPITLWHHGNQLIRIGHDGFNGTHLSISQLKESDGGSYECVAFNNISHVYLTTNIIITGLPVTTRNIHHSFASTQHPLSLYNDSMGNHNSSDHNSSDTKLAGKMNLLLGIIIILLAI